jgi:heme-degrading monooxygenase HmoA
MSGEPQVVHLVEFRIQPGHEVEVVAALRHPELFGPRPEGLLADSVGRRLGHQRREHVLATSWRDEASWRAGIDDGQNPRCLARVAHMVEDRRSSAFRVVASKGPSWDEGKILRVYRGAVGDESMARWEAWACGPAGAVGTDPGLVSLLVGPSMLPDERPGEQVVVAVTAWRDWEAVLAATGGHLDHLLRETEMTELERPLSVEHYQLLNGGSAE